MNECYIKLLNAIQAECEKQANCLACKYRNLCEVMEVALEELEQEQIASADN